jgi:predicted nucleotidyltransferase
VHTGHLNKNKIKYNKNANHEEMQAFMEEKFPKLKSAGVFEVLRASVVLLLHCIVYG